MTASALISLGEQYGNRIYMKRDDLLPYCFGGNKYRKALLFFQQIDQGGFDTVVTYGTRHSNHCRIIANMAAERGLECHIISPQGSEEETYNSRMMQLFGAVFTMVPVGQVHDTIEHTLESLRAAGKKPYFIEGGGHGDLGTAAYAACYDEIISWSEEHNISFDYIFLASGTGTTQAGLVCGKLMRRDPVQIIGISIARTNPRGRNIVLDSVRHYLNSKSYSCSDELIEKSVCFLDDYITGGYSGSSAEELTVIRRVLLQYGIPLDTTYTGKAFFGMEQYLNANRISGKKILFLHTGGTPLFFDDLKRLVDL